MKAPTAISFPAFSGLFPTFIAAAAAAPEEIPTFKEIRIQRIHVRGRVFVHTKNKE